MTEMAERSIKIEGDDRRRRNEFRKGKVDMEIVLRLRRQGVSGIHWERQVRACLLLVLSCILYWCIRAYGSDYTEKWEDTEVYAQKLKQDGRIGDDVYIEHICGNVNKMSILYGREAENIAAHRLEEYRGFLAITGQIECPVEPEESQWTPSQAENIGTVQSVWDRITIQQEGEIDFPFLESKEETKNDIPFIEDKEETKNDIPFIENEEETKNDIPFIENEEEAEDDMSFVQDEDTSVEENDEIREIAGFIVDNQGYIVGITGALSFLDGILAIASDSECVGIRRDAFANVEAEVMEIYIPANICDIESGAFDGFSNLMYIEVAEDSLYYYSMDGILYSKTGEEIAYPAGR